MRSVRARSVVCMDTVAQSTSHTTRRPPARKARCNSTSAAGTSATYSSTCTDSAASKLAFSTGSEVASASWNATLSCPSQRCAARASIGGSHVLEQLGNVEPRSAADVHDAFARGDAESVADQPPAAQHVARAIERFEHSRGALVELQLAHPLIATRTPR